MHTFVVLGLVFSTPSRDIGVGKRLRNDLFCVERGVKPRLSQSVYDTGAACVCVVVQMLWCEQLHGLVQHQGVAKQTARPTRVLSC